MVGMSEGPTVNGDGYTGLAHAHYTDNNSTAQLPRVISFTVILSRCIEKLVRNQMVYEMLKSPEQCPRHSGV